MTHKKAYAAPVLRTYGDVRALTQSQGEGLGVGVGLGLIGIGMALCKHPHKPDHIHSDDCFVGLS